MHRIRDSPHIPKGAIYFDIARFSNFQFSAITSSTFSDKISIENTALVDEYSTKKSLFFSLASQSRKFKENILDLIFHDFQTQISPKLQALSLPPGSVPKSF